MFKAFTKLSGLILLFAGIASAQTINPNQIRPAGTNGYVLTTVAGQTVWAPAGAGCSVSGLPSSAILYTNGTGCLGSDNWTFSPGGSFNTVDLNGGASPATNSRILVEGSNTTNNNQVEISGQFIDVQFDGANHTSGTGGITVEGQDNHASLDAGMDLVVANYEITQADDTATSFVSEPNVTGAIASGDIESFIADKAVFSGGATAPHVYGPHCRRFGIQASSEEVCFIVNLEVPNASVNSDYSDLLSRDSNGVVRVQLGSGPTAASNFGGPVSVNDGTGAAGFVGIAQGTAQSTVANEIGLSAPASVTAYNIELPGTAPSGSNTLLNCSNATPSICTWAAATGGTPGGSNQQIQYNNSGSFGGSSGGITNGTHWAFGTGATINPASIPIADSTTGTLVMNVSETSTAAAGVNGMAIQVTNTPSSAVANNNTSVALAAGNTVNYDGQATANTQNIGSVGFATLTGNTRAIDTLEGGAFYARITGNAAATNVAGITGEVDLNGSGAIEQTEGQQGIVTLKGNGTVDFMYGYNAGTGTNGPGTINNDFGVAVYGGTDPTNGGTLHVYHGFDSIYYPGAATTTTTSANFYSESPDVNDGDLGTITNQYGLYIEEQKPTGGTATVTNGWQIYSAGTAPTYFHSATMQFDNVTGHGTAGIGHLSNTGVLSQSLVSLTADVSGTLPVANGGTGTGGTLTGLMRGNASAMTAAEISGDCTTSGSNSITCTKTSGTAFTGYATATFVANTTITVGNGVAFSANTCSSYTGTGGTASTTAMTGLLTSMTITHTPTTDVHAVTGWSPAAGGSLYFTSWPTAGQLNDYVCNPTASTITTGGSVTWNVSAR